MGKMGLIYWELYRSSCVTNLQGRILNLGYIVYTWGKTKNGVSQGCGESGKLRGIIELDVLTTKGFYGGWRVLLEMKNNEIGV